MVSAAVANLLLSVMANISYCYQIRLSNLT